MSAPVPSRPARIKGILGHIGHGYRRLPVGSGGGELSELGSSLPRQRSGDDARRRRRRGARAELAEDGRGLALERVRAKGGTERSAKVDRGGRRERLQRHEVGGRGLDDDGGRSLVVETFVAKSTFIAASLFGES